jgi:putative endonuclease
LLKKYNIIGTWGELVVGRVLEASGYQILAKNYHTFEGELDIICLHRGMIVFVEVKTRRNNHFGSGEESVTQNKLLKLAKCGMRYLDNERVDDFIWRIDVAVVDQIGPHCYQLKHYQNVSLDLDENRLDDC